MADKIVYVQRLFQVKLVVGVLVGSTNGNTAITVVGFRLVVAVCRVWRSLSCAGCCRSRRLLGLLRLCLLLLRTLHVRARV